MQSKCLAASQPVTRCHVYVLPCAAVFAVVIVHLFVCVLQEGASRVVELCVGDGGGTATSTSSSPSSPSSGQYYVKHSIAQPSVAALDEGKAAECWRLSAQAVGLPADRYGGLPVVAAPQQ